jgi:hypothetical protein
MTLERQCRSAYAKPKYLARESNYKQSRGCDLQRIAGNLRSKYILASSARE